MVRWCTSEYVVRSEFHIYHVWRDQESGKFKDHYSRAKDNAYSLRNADYVLRQWGLLDSSIPRICTIKNLVSCDVIYAALLETWRNCQCKAFLWCSNEVTCILEPFVFSRWISKMFILPRRYFLAFSSIAFLLKHGSYVEQIFKLPLFHNCLCLTMLKSILPCTCRSTDLCLNK